MTKRQRSDIRRSARLDERPNSAQIDPSDADDHVDERGSGLVFEASPIFGSDRRACGRGLPGVLPSAATELRTPGPAIRRHVSLLLSWASEDLRTWVRGVRQRADAVGTSGGLVRGVAGVEDRPSDLGAPLLFIAGFVGADGVVLAYRPVDREGVIGDVGRE